MAKKKKAAGPQKACVQCGKMMHARKGSCDHCGATQPSGKKAAKKRSSKKSKKTRRQSVTRTAVGLDAVESAADFISAVGGVKEAKQALAKAETLAKKFS